MAIIWQPKKKWNPNRGKATTNVVQQPVAEAEVNTAPVIKAQPVQPVAKDESLQQILSRLNALENENAKLRGNDAASIAMSKKEKFKWPRHYAFTMWGGIPVLSRTSKRMDATKDLVFKNQFGQYESNHALVLKLANGEETEVEVNIFNRDKQKTEPLPCSIITTEDGTTVYVFNTPDYWKLELLEPYLN